MVWPESDAWGTKPVFPELHVFWSPREPSCLRDLVENSRVGPTPRPEGRELKKVPRKPSITFGLERFVVDLPKPQLTDPNARFFPNFPQDGLARSFSRFRPSPRGDPLSSPRGFRVQTDEKDLPSEVFDPSSHAESESLGRSRLHPTIGTRVSDRDLSIHNEPRERRNSSRTNGWLEGIRAVGLIPSSSP
jgi:hypothetical protein